MSQTAAASSSQNSVENAIQGSLSCSWCRALNRGDAKTCVSCGAPVLAPARTNQKTFANVLAPGTRLRAGDYEIQDVIGQGSGGIIYRAFNHRLHRLVAIKECFPDSCERDGRQLLADKNATEFARSKAAFLEEARALARFDQAAIVSVFAVWEENGSAYMEMELLHGPTLAQILERFHHFRADDALRIFAPLLQALQQLHDQDWLHLAINPHHIVLCHAAFDAKDAANCVRQARAVLIDFGAARQIRTQAAQEAEPRVVPGYTPLEQYTRSAQCGVYTDIYALCATLYHTLSGQVPPPADERANGRELIPLRQLAPAVPASTCAAIESGLKIEIVQRPQACAHSAKFDVYANG